MKKQILFVHILFIVCCNSVIKAQWTELGGNNSLKANAMISCLTTDLNGNIYAGGDFTNAMGRNYVAKFNGKEWIDIQGGSTLVAHGTIEVINTDKKGNIYVGGRFKNSSGNNYVAMFDTTWQELGGSNSLGSSGVITSIVFDKSGNVYTAGSFMNSAGMSYIAKYDGTKWIELGGVNSLDKDQVQQNSPTAMVFDSKENLYVSGLFVDFTHNLCLRKFNGSTWSSILIDSSLVCCDPKKMAIDSKDNIYIPGGVKNNFGYYNVVKYDGIKWSELGGSNSLSSKGSIASLYVDKKDHVYAVGDFSNSGKKYSIAMFDGIKWNFIGGDYFSSQGAWLTCFTMTFDDKILVGGEFENKNGKKFVAQLSCSSTVNEVNAIFQESVGYKFGDQTLYKAGIYYDTFASQSGCDSIVKLILKTSSSISQLSDNPPPLFYPNPAGENIKLFDILNRNFQIKIHSLDGKLIFEEKNAREIDISKFERGTYIVHFISEKEKITQKIQLE